MLKTRLCLIGECFVIWSEHVFGHFINSKIPLWKRILSQEVNKDFSKNLKKFYNPWIGKAIHICLVY